MSAEAEQLREELSEEVQVTVNGVRQRATVPQRRLLIHFLRDDLGLRGPHVGCDTGNCGACTVEIDGKLAKSCMVLAVQVDGAEVTTAESLASDGRLSDLQQAFHEHHAVQCGYCTPGMLMSARFLLERNPSPTDEEIRRALKGNICRCTGYENIVKAIAAVSGRKAEAAR